MKFILIVAGLTAFAFVIMTIAAKGRRTHEAEERAKLPKIAPAVPLPNIATVIRGCAALMERTEPMAFYDENGLPCPKDLAEKSVVAAISLSPSEQRPQLFVMLEWLSQFQAGVGDTPVSLMVPNLAEKLATQTAGTLSGEALMKELAGMGDGSPRRVRWEDLNRKAESDRARYLTLYKTATARAGNI